MRNIIIFFLERLWKWFLNPLLWNKLWDAGTFHYMIRCDIIDLAAKLDKSRKSWAVLGLWPHSTLDDVTVAAIRICYKANLCTYANKPWKIRETKQAFEEVMQTPLAEVWEREWYNLEVRDTQ